MLVWYEEDVWGMLVGTDNFIWVKMPLTNQNGSVAKRNGNFKLLDDGTLEGDVTIAYTGQLGLTMKIDGQDDSAAKREQDLKDALTRQISSAEVSAVSIENISDPSKPLIHKYKVRVPNYAQKTGKRLFLQPGFFEYGSNPLFSSASRKYDIFFKYPWSEEDKISIAFPKDFDLDNADVPAEVADPQKIGSLAIKVGVDKQNSVLVYDRKFYFGNEGRTLFPASAYVPVKNLFDSFHKADTHVITLKQR
jgi:hypothetical protein